MLRYQGKLLLERYDSPYELGNRGKGDPFPQYWNKHAPLGSSGSGLSITGPLYVTGSSFLDCPVVINDSGDACNPVLRVESDSLENLLYVDGANNRLGINTPTPDTLFHVLGETKLDGRMEMHVPNAQFNAFDILVSSAVQIRYDTLTTNTWTWGHSGATIETKWGTNARVTSHVLPNELANLSPTYDLGGPTSNLWRNFYVQKVYADNLILAPTYAEYGADITLTDETYVVATSIPAAGYRVFTLPLAANREANSSVTIKDGTTGVTRPDIGVPQGIEVARQGGDVIDSIKSEERIHDLDGAIKFTSDGISKWWSF